MVPISPVNVASAGPMTGVTPMQNGSNNAVQADTNTARGSFATPFVSIDSLAITQVHSAVSQLVQGSGGGLENNKILRICK